MRFLIKQGRKGVRFLESWSRGDERAKTSQLKILVIDTNLAIDHAVRFAEDGHVVYYHVADITAFPKLTDTCSGDGIEGIAKVEDFASVVDSVDLVYFTDNCFPFLARSLREKGKVVYGPTPELVKWENDRIYAYKRMKGLGIGVPDGEVVRGVKELVKWIEGREDGKTRFWVKVNKVRGNVETFSVLSSREAETMIAQADFGPYMNELEFLVQMDCSGVEIGVDAWVCGRGVLKPYSYTIEEKGRGNIAVWVEGNGFEQMFYSKVQRVVEEDDYRCNLSIEGFWDGVDLKVIDVTARNPYPVSALYPRFVENFTEVVWAVANNEVVDVKVDRGNKYMAEITVSTDVSDMWRVINSGDGEYKVKGVDGVGYRRVVRKDGQYWFVPGDGLVCTCNARGKSPEEALEKAKKIAEGVSCMYSQWDGAFIESVLEKVKKLNNMRGLFVF